MFLGALSIILLNLTLPTLLVFPYLKEEAFYLAALDRSVSFFSCDSYGIGIYFLPLISFKFVLLFGDFISGNTNVVFAGSSLLFYILRTSVLDV